MAEGAGQGKRIFSYEQAVVLLPEVRRITEAAQARVQGVGASISTDDAPSVDAQRELAMIVQAWADQLIALGLVVKGLWLVDFDNGSGYYCWRHPEEGLHFYHSYEDGFGGRMRIQ